MKIKLNIICDTLFFGFICFLFVFAWGRYYSRSLSLALLLASFASLVTILTAMWYLLKRDQKQNLTKAETNLINELTERLNLLESNEVLSYFFSACTTNENPRKTKMGIIFNDSTLFAPIFSNIELTPSLFTRVINFAHKNNLNKVIFATSKLDTDMQKLALKVNLSCEFWNKEMLFKKKGRLLSLPICPLKSIKPQRLKFNQVFYETLKKTRAKHYILFGLVLLVFSSFIPMKLYYLIFGTLLLSFGLFTLFIRQKSKLTNS